MNIKKVPPFLADKCLRGVRGRNLLELKRKKSAFNASV